MNVPLLAGDIVFAVCLLTFYVWFALRQGVDCDE